MGGFEWYTIVERDKGKRAKVALEELHEWAQNPIVPETLAYFASRLSDFDLVLPEQADEVYLECRTFDREKVEGKGITYGEYFGFRYPGEGEALLYAREIPWFERIGPEIRAKAAECFDKHGVLDVWDDLLRYATGQGKYKSQKF